MAIEQSVARGPRRKRDRDPSYRHATVVPLPWVDQMLNPLSWRVGHWAMFGAVLTLAADIITGLYLFNFFGIGRQFELQMWLLIAGSLGFVSITASLYAIFFKSGRATGIFAFICSFIVGAAPAWLVLNTILQFIINGGTLPDAPINW
ncbi:hypothetical protein [Gulosibacter sp. ACHW.36C]|uniref:Uncharacterized protein n=1 Tax=Gulosibacter sediminis TaxID=1729695 RepID=A0ABY4MVZ6_9MICO|nr:hypothetical protein [Gulosibacter sediminis]UQN14601.1 hypothetical protein M3M28_11210 [Gulosibacter sediminis]